MNKETRLEITLRTIKLDSVTLRFKQIDAAKEEFTRLYRQTHETINGRKKVLSPRRKVAIYKAKVARIFSDDIDVSRDAINQVKVMRSGR